jgi:hypothetical protein
MTGELVFLAIIPPDSHCLQIHIYMYVYTQGHYKSNRNFQLFTEAKVLLT